MELILSYVIGVLVSAAVACLYVRWWIRDYRDQPARLCYRCGTAFLECTAEYGPGVLPRDPALVMECPRCRGRDLIPLRLP